MTPLDRMLTWLRQEGVTFPRLDVRTSPSGERSVYAAAPITARERVADVPERVVITQITAQESPFGRRVADAALPLNNPDSAMAAWLLDERARTDSRWQPYFATLPESFPTFPLLYEPADLAWLKGSSLIEHLEEHRDALVEDDRLLREALPDYARFSLQEFLWARCVLWSRRYGGEVNGRHISALVPVLDMLNHRTRYNLVWGCFPDEVRFQAAPTEFVRAGTELLTTYGHKSNREMLVHYGFVVEENSHDVSALVMSLPDTLPLAGRKRELLAGRDDPAALFRFNLCVPRKPQEQVAHAELFSFLRLAQADEAELTALLAAGRKPTELGPIGARNEVAALRMLEEACRAMLAGFETTRDDDERLLRQGGLSINARNCVVLRRGEKRLLRHYVDHARTMAARIEKSPGAFDRQIQGS